MLRNRNILVFLTSLMIITPILGLATTINIPADYPTIQQGIDMSVNGDTVLVQPGTYIENISFNSKSIKLASLYFTTGEPAYIDSTIIDGGQNSSVVTMFGAFNNTTMLIGFTIKNGFSIYGAGIHVNGGFPAISNNIITANTGPDSMASGAGIRCVGTYATIVSNMIVDNGPGFNGVAIQTQNSSPTIINNNITGNYGIGWGTIYLNNSNAYVWNNLIAENEIGDGGGIWLHENDNTVIASNIIIKTQRAYRQEEEFVAGNLTPLSKIMY